MINHSTTFDNGVLGADGKPAHGGAAFYAAHADLISATGELTHLRDDDA